jgi:hypothetical protein
MKRTDSQKKRSVSYGRHSRKRSSSDSQRMNLVRENAPSPSSTEGSSTTAANTEFDSEEKLHNEKTEEEAAEGNSWKVNWESSPASKRSSFIEAKDGLADLPSAVSSAVQVLSFHIAKHRLTDSFKGVLKRAAFRHTIQSRRSRSTRGYIKKPPEVYRRRSTAGINRRHSISGLMEEPLNAARDYMRRGSAVIEGGLHHVEIGGEMGNPFGLRVNETTRISSNAFTSWPDKFDGRLPAEQLLRRRPSEIKKDHISIITRADDDPDDFVIQRVAAYDDIDHMSRWKVWVYRTAPLWVLLSLVFYWLYFALRVRFTLAAQASTHQIFVLAWIFITVESCVAIPMVLHRSWSVLVLRGRRRPKLRLIGNSVPSVDVIITCCKEDDDLIMDTARAACNVDYPSDRFRVMILDDGASATLKALVESGTHGFSNMHYLSRPKYPGVPHHFKAGNLNYALAQTTKMSGGAANFIACLDADMIPERDWLRALLPHMLQDTKCCMACPPQVSCNWEAWLTKIMDLHAPAFL